ncbi:Sbal_3080 family lipoprotein [Shewanella basaltis]|uniref:Sbal_3080 family lipoprotein n=1 Tax=Shewanella basaltis TaxID=472183 RepID=UPI003AB07C21
MKKIILISSLAFLATACTSIQVQPIKSGLNPEKICIEENPKVIVGDFLSVVRNRIEYHGIDTEVYENDIPEGCEYTMTYTALKNWDLGTYMHHAELRLERNGRRVGYAEYHLNGKGGLSLLKWQGTKTKMDPVVDELLGK